MNFIRHITSVSCRRSLDSLVTANALGIPLCKQLPMITTQLDVEEVGIPFSSRYVAEFICNLHNMHVINATLHHEKVCSPIKALARDEMEM